MADNQPDQPQDQPEEETQSTLSRRQFLARLSVVAAGLGGLLLAVPFLRFLTAEHPPVEVDPWAPIGPLEEFPMGVTRTVSFADPTALPWAGFAAGQAAFVRREADDQFVAYSVYCTHVGCPIRWEEGAQLFMCPCHGGVFHRDGAPAGGPPTRPLDEYPVRIRNGQVEIRRTPFPIPGGGNANA